MSKNDQQDRTSSNARAVTIAGPRLPYHPAVQERFGIGLTEWRALTDAVFPLAKEPESVIMALAYCKARNLDPFKKPVHIVPMWHGQLKRMVETVWPGIGELRTTAFRTGQYAGRDHTVYGPEIKQAVGKTMMVFPEWCQITLYRNLSDVRVPFPGPRVYWLESYATAGREDNSPNSMWARRPFGQLEKCAEAAALRSAFPEEVGNEYAAEEMEGRVIDIPAGPRTGNVEKPAALADRMRAISAPRADQRSAQQTDDEDHHEDRSRETGAKDAGGDDQAPSDDAPPASDDQQGEALDPMTEEGAFARGQEAKADGLSRRAMPGEYRNEPKLSGAWTRGFDTPAEQGGEG